MKSATNLFDGGGWWCVTFPSLTWPLIGWMVGASVDLAHQEPTVLKCWWYYYWGCEIKTLSHIAAVPKLVHTLKVFIPQIIYVIRWWFCVATEKRRAELLSLRFDRADWICWSRGEQICSILSTCCSLERVGFSRGHSAKLDVYLIFNRLGNDGTSSGRSNGGSSLPPCTSSPGMSRLPARGRNAL